MKKMYNLKKDLLLTKLETFTKDWFVFSEKNGLITLSSHEYNIQLKNEDDRSPRWQIKYNIPGFRGKVIRQKECLDLLKSLNWWQTSVYTWDTFGYYYQRFHVDEWHFLREWSLKSNLSFTRLFNAFNIVFILNYQLDKELNPIVNIKLKKKLTLKAFNVYRFNDKKIFHMTREAIKSGEIGPLIDYLVDQDLINMNILNSIKTEIFNKRYTKAKQIVYSLKYKLNERFNVNWKNTSSDNWLIENFNLKVNITFEKDTDAIIEKSAFYKGNKV